MSTGTWPPRIGCMAFGDLDRHVINTHRQNQNHHPSLLSPPPLPHTPPPPLPSPPHHSPTHLANLCGLCSSAITSRQEATCVFFKSEATRFAEHHLSILKGMCWTRCVSGCTRPETKRRHRANTKHSLADARQEETRCERMFTYTTGRTAHEVHATDEGEGRGHSRTQALRHDDCPMCQTCLMNLRIARKHVVNAMRKGRYVDRSARECGWTDQTDLIPPFERPDPDCTRTFDTVVELRQHVIRPLLAVWTLHHALVQCAPVDNDSVHAAYFSEQAPIALSEQERHGRLAATLHWRRTLARNEEERQRKKSPRGRAAGAGLRVGAVRVANSRLGGCGAAQCSSRALMRSFKKWPRLEKTYAQTVEESECFTDWAPRTRTCLWPSWKASKPRGSLAAAIGGEVPGSQRPQRHGLTAAGVRVGPCVAWPQPSANFEPMGVVMVSWAVQGATADDPGPLGEVAPSHDQNFTVRACPHAVSSPSSASVSGSTARHGKAPRGVLRRATKARARAPPDRDGQVLLSIGMSALWLTLERFRVRLGKRMDVACEASISPPAQGRITSTSIATSSGHFAEIR